MGRRVAWVSELVDDEAYDPERRRGVARGRFWAHIEDDALPDGFVSEGAETPLHAALRWARARSPAVILRLVGSDGQLLMYSAGEDEPPWP